MHIFHAFLHHKIKQMGSAGFRPDQHEVKYAQIRSGRIPAGLKSGVINSMLVRPESGQTHLFHFLQNMHQSQLMMENAHLGQSHL